MRKNGGFSKKALTVIEYVWFAISLIIAMNLEENLHLYFWEYICIGVALAIIGESLIRKFIRVKEQIYT